MARKLSKYVLRSELDQAKREADHFRLAMHDMINDKVCWQTVRHEGDRYKLGVCRMKSVPLLIIIFKCKGQDDSVMVSEYHKTSEAWLRGSGSSTLECELRIAAGKAYMEAQRETYPPEKPSAYKYMRDNPPPTPSPDLSDSGPYATTDDKKIAEELEISVRELREDRWRGDAGIELMKKEDKEIEDADQHVDVEPLH